MVCLGQSEWSTSLNFNVTYLRDFVFEEAESKGLSGGGIAGIVIACVVATAFIIGLILSIKGTAWLRTLFCCQNKTMDLPEKDIERSETGLQNADANGQQNGPIPIHPNHDNKQPMSIVDPELMNATSVLVQDMNQTGSAFLPRGATMSNDTQHPNASYQSNREATSDKPLLAGNGHYGSPKPSTATSSGLPNIHVDKRGAASEWKELDEG